MVQLECVLRHLTRDSFLDIDLQTRNGRTKRAAWPGNEGRFRMLQVQVDMSVHPNWKQGISHRTMRCRYWRRLHLLVPVTVMGDCITEWRRKTSSIGCSSFLLRSIHSVISCRSDHIKRRAVWKLPRLISIRRSVMRSDKGNKPMRAYRCGYSPQGI